MSNSGVQFIYTSEGSVSLTVDKPDGSVTLEGDIVNYEHQETITYDENNDSAT